MNAYTKVQAWHFAKFLLPGKWKTAKAFFYEYCTLGDSAAAGVGSPVNINGGLPVIRRSPRRQGHYVEPSRALEITDKNKNARHHNQNMCAVCGIYKTQHRCGLCKAYICRSGAYNAKKDTCIRGCWEDHIANGVPRARGRKRVGPWHEDYGAMKRAADAKAGGGAERRATLLGGRLPMGDV